MKNLLWFVLLLPASAIAAETAADSVITAATVFPDRADVTRTADVSLPAGKSVIRFDSLPALMYPSSLRVSGKGAFKIGSVETKRIYLKDTVAEREKELQDKITALSDKRSLIEADLKAAATGKAFLENMSKSAFTPPAPDAAKKQGAAPDAWSGAWKSLRDGMKTLGREEIAQRIALRDIDAELSALRQEKRDLFSGSKSFYQVRVNVEARKPVEAKVTLRYRVSGASWTPKYEARLNTETGKVDLSQYGEVSQRTGEDWKNVALTLSTAETGAEMTPPEPNPARLNLRSKEQDQKIHLSKGIKSARGRAFNARRLDTLANEDVENGVMFAAAAPALPMQETAVVEQADFSGSDFTGLFDVKGASTLLSDGAARRFAITEYALPVKLSALAVPALKPAAYLTAAGTFKSDASLIAGEMSLYRDGAFIGSSALSPIRPNEEFKISFGQDEKIIVEYAVLKDKKTDGGLISTSSSHQKQSRTTIRNKHKAPTDLIVYQTLPQALNDDIAVSVVKSETTGGYTENADGKPGVVQWTATAAPNEVKTFDFGYTVSWPKDKVLY